MGGDVPPPIRAVEENARLKMQVESNAAEIKNLRDWKHDLAQKPQADLFKLAALEHSVETLERSVESLESKIDDNTKLTERVLTSLNGEDDKPGIRGRLQAVESKMTTLTRVIWIVAGAAAAVFVKAFWGILAGSKS